MFCNLSQNVVIPKWSSCPANMSIIRELCDIRDGRHIACDIISKTEVCSLLDIICTE